MTGVVWMTGAEIDAEIMKLLQKMPTVLGYHHPDSRRATLKGFPDWVFIGRRVLYREVKGSSDDLSREQRRVGRALYLANADWEVWQPLDVRPGGRAEMQLTAIA